MGRGGGQGGGTVDDARGAHCAENLSNSIDWEFLPGVFSIDAVETLE